MVEVNNLTFAYGDGLPVFDGFSWAVRAGEAWAVIGPSGCGKSTLLYLIAGLRQPKGGRILVDGHPVPRPRASTGLVLQDYGLLPWATVWENVALPMRLGRFYRGKGAAGDSERPYPRPDIVPQQVDAWLGRLGISNQRSKYPAQLSGGQRQRAAIARSLLQQPNLLLMDEPFAALDAITKKILLKELVRIWKETRKTIFYITHDILEAITLGTRIGVMSMGPDSFIRNEFPVTVSEPRVPTNDDFNRLFLQIEKVIEEEVQKVVDVREAKEA